MKFIEQVIIFLRDASVMPSSLWVHKYYGVRRSLLHHARNIESIVENHNDATERLRFLITVLEEEEVQETKLVVGFTHLLEIFVMSKIEDPELKKFQKLLEDFSTRVKNEQYFEKLRTGLLSKINEDEQSAYDLKLFQNEGTSYFIEYYLAAYKALTDLKTSQEKINFLDAKEVDFGFGKLVGLRKDLEADESLNKFILLILDDGARLYLEEIYYELKTDVLIASDPDFIEKRLKEFIYYALIKFQEQGITELSSTFFKPYGEKPKVVDLLRFFGGERYE